MNDPAEVVLEIRGLSKNFPGVKALQDVDLVVRRGEVHALMGENGAGKSTLIKVLTGVYPRDAGSIRLNGVEIDPPSPKAAETLGVSTGVSRGELDPAPIGGREYLSRTAANPLWHDSLAGCRPPCRGCARSC